MSDSFEVSFDPSARWKTGCWRVASLAAVAISLCLLPQFDLLPRDWHSGLLLVGLTLLAATAVVKLKMVIGWYTDRQMRDVLLALVEQDETACVIANANGEVLVSNTQARTRFHAHQGARLDDCLRSVFANPAAILLRLQSLTLDQGSARDEVVTRGRAVGISASRLDQDKLCWRFGLNAESRWQSVPAPILTVGRNDKILGVNDAAEELLGCRPENLADVFPLAGFDNGRASTISAAVGPRTVLTTELNSSGLERYLLLLPVDNSAADQVETSMEDLPVPIMSLSPEGEILELNPLAAQLVGDVKPGQTNIADIMQGLGHPISDWLTRTAEQDLPPHSEFLRLTRKDQEIFVQVTLSRVMREGAVCLIAVLNDATELKTLEAQFVQGQKMQAVGQLAGGVAHDFNNLLTAISGHCDLLLLRHDQNDPNYGDLVQINQNANRAAALVSQLLAFSRKQNLRPEVLDLRDTISDLIHLLNRLVGEKVRLVLSHDPVLKPVRADKRQLEQVLMNLVVNARDAMPEGGEIRIETEVLTLDQPMTRDRATVQAGEYVTVKVVDSGVGIPADKLQKVFEPFYTTKRTGEGTGLGLSTVYGIVKQTGGFIFVDSIPGHGTEFTVYLPVSAQVEALAPETRDTLPEQGPRQGEGVVLLVEDEAPVRAFATRALRLKGYTVLEADSAEEALHLLEDDNLTVDAFVTDVVMPGMDGPTWVRQALKSRPEVRVIFMSGYTEGAFGDAGPDIANSTFLPKPFSLTQLTEAVFQQLN